MKPSSPLLPLLLLMFLGIFAIGNYGFGLNEVQVHWWADLAWTFASLAAGIRCYMTARAADGDMRLAWTHYAMACFSWALGMLVWDFEELVIGKMTPFPAFSDFGFLGFAMFFIAGTYYFYRRNTDTSFTLIQLSKLGIIVCAVALVHLVVFYPAINSSTQPLFYLVTALAYPMLYMTMFVYTVFYYLLYRNKIKARENSLLLAAAMVHAFTCTLYAYELLGSSYKAGHYLDIFWLLGFALLYWAAHQHLLPGKQVKQQLAVPQSTRLLLFENLLPPLVLFFAVTAVLLSTASRESGYYTIILLVLMLLVLLMGFRDWLSQRQENLLLAAVSDSEARYRSLFEGANEAICVMDLEQDCVVDINQAGEGLFGLGRAEILAAGCTIFSGPFRTDGTHCQEIIERHMDEAIHGEKPVFEWTFHHAGGLDIPCEVRLSRLSDVDRVLIHALITDISDRVRARLALEQHSKELEQRVQERTRDLIASREEAVRANAAKSDFLSRMSHELRTPMNAILGFSQLLQRDEKLDTPEQKDSIDEIVRAGMHLLELINDMLDLSRIEAGKLRVDIHDVDIAPILAESVALVRASAEARGIQIESPDVSESGITIAADHIRLKQVLLNLLSNAVKYNHEGGWIRVSVHEPDAATLRISVCDTGPGISADQVASLFEPFNRLGMDKNFHIDGVGIGLTISHHLVTMMHGTLTVDSAPGQGSCFHVTLPQDASTWLLNDSETT